MRTHLAVLLLASALACACAFTFDKEASTLEGALRTPSPRDAFDKWMMKHNKQYASDEEREARFKVWLGNAQRVVARNQEEGRRTKLGLNGLADVSPEEFKSKFLSPTPFKGPDAAGGRGAGSLPANASTSASALTGGNDYFHWRYERVRPRKQVDWRNAGVMGPVRSQHAHNWSCGGCWAFATVGIVEASSTLTTGVVTPASEQQLIDCDVKHDHGCDGGEFHNALDYIIYNKGLTTENDYPYAGQTNPCNYKKEKDHKVKVDDWESVPPFNETALMQALSMRPVISAICCGSNLDDWHHYDGGVFDVPCCMDKLELDHAIVLVGYGTSPEGEPYFILKNSWSEEWGEKGYMKIRRNVTNVPWGQSQCGLASMPTMVFRGPKPLPPDAWAEEGEQGETSSQAEGNGLLTWASRLVRKGSQQLRKLGFGNN